MLKRIFCVFALIAGCILWVWLREGDYHHRSFPLRENNQVKTASSVDPVSMATSVAVIAAFPRDAVISTNSPVTAPVHSSLTYGRVRFEHKEKADKTGYWREIRIVEANFICPLIRVEETYFHDTRTGEKQILMQKEMVADHMIVRLRPHVLETELRELIQQHGMRLLRKLQLTGAYLVQFPAMSIDALPEAVKTFTDASEAIAYAEPDFIVHASQLFPNDPEFGELYGLHNVGQSAGLVDSDIDIPEAWVTTTGSPLVVVGIVDTGVDYQHPDLAANMWINPGEIPGDQIDNDNNGYVDDVYGWDFINNDSDPFDDNSHGTHCAGTVAAVGNNGVGVVGVNWISRIMALKFLSAGGSGLSSAAVDALAYAAMMKQRGVNIRLTSNSWGGGGATQALEDAIELNKQHDILFVAAAGNDNSNNDAFPTYPSSHTNENIISVAATDRNDLQAGFSNYGALSVDLGAPGVSILSTIPGNDYGYKSGTSMATPHVAGVVALMLSLAPDTDWLDIKDSLLAGVDLIPSMAGKTTTDGRLNALGAFQALSMRVRATIPSRNETVLSPPASVTVLFYHPIHPASVQASDCLMNEIAADSYTIEGADSVLFHFLQTPVTNEGLQSINIPDGAVTRLDLPQSNRMYQSQFRFDSLPMEVVASIPEAGSNVSLSLTNIILQVNEPINPATIGMEDLAVSQGAVSSATLLNSNTVSYGIQGVTKEAVLLVKLLAGALTDSYGNPSLIHEFMVNLDVETALFPVPLTRVPPAGSMIYEGSTRAFITENDTDDFTIELPGGHTVTAWATAEGNFQAVISLIDPWGQVLAMSQASQAEGITLIQSILLPTNGVYTLRVSGEEDSIGEYRLHMVINAAVEEEIFGLGLNDQLNSAQPLDFNSIPMGHTSSARAASKGSIRSSGMQSLLMESFETGTLNTNWTTWSSLPGGRIRVTDEVESAGGSYSLLFDRTLSGSNTLNEAVWEVDLSGLNQVELHFKHAQWNEERQIWANDRRTGHFDADSISISDKGGAWYQVWRPVYQLPGVWLDYHVDLTMPAELGRMRFGPDFKIKIQQFDNESFPDDGQGFDNLEIKVPEPTADWYRVELATDDRVEIRLTPKGRATLDVALYDASNQLLRTGISVKDISDKLIADVPVFQPGSYYIQVSGAGQVDYTLLVLRNSAFDTEPNDHAEEVRDITHIGGALGDISSAAVLHAYEAPSLDLGSILRLDPVTLAVLDSFTAPYHPEALYGSFTGEMSFDGQHYWFSGGQSTGGINRIFKIDKDTGDASAHFDVTTPTVINGVASLNGELFLGTQQHTIEVYDDITFVHKRSLPDNLPGWLTGLEGSTTRNQIIASAKADTIYALNPLTGAVVQQHLLAPRPEGIEISLGLAPGEIFVGNYAGDKEMLVFRSDTMQLSRELEWPGSPLGGLGGTDEGGTFENYSVKAHTGDSLIIMVTTPASGVSAFATTSTHLNLLIDVYDPDGSEVANGIANSALNHQTQQSGEYLIRLYSTNHTFGEYMLTVSGSTVAPSNSSTLVLTIPPEVFMECGEFTSPAETGSATASSDCASQISVTHTDIIQSAACSGMYDIIRTWFAQDECGSSASGIQVIHITDTWPPEIQPPLDVSLNWGADIHPDLLGTALVADVCSQANISGYMDTITNGLELNEVRILRIWMAEDSCGNAGGMLQTITITNVVPPVMSPSPAYVLGDHHSVSWTGPDPVDVYQAQYASNGTFSDAWTSDWITGTVLITTGLTEGIEYFYRAKAALNTPAGYLETGWSEPVSTVPLDPEGDWDGDGQINREESIVGTDPLEAASNFELLSLSEEAGQLKMIWRGGTTATHIVEFLPNISVEWWDNLFTNGLPMDITNTLILDLPDEDGGVYRIRAYK